MVVTKRLFAAAIVLLVAIATLPAQVGSTGESENNSGGSVRQPVTRVYSLTINSNVRGAVIFVDGVRQNELAPATLRLREGSYTIRVEARGYDAFQTRVSLGSNRTIFAQLQSPTATVVLQVPSEMLNNRLQDPWRMIDFYVDGRLRQEAQVQVEPGYRTITIVSGGLRFEDEFYFEAGRYYTIELLLRASIFSGN